jgi:ATP-dependent helicase/nuclease subunit A
VTDAKDGDSLAPGGVVFEATNTSRRRRPHGKRFGIVVHSVLATVALGADEAAIAGAATIQGRLVSATDEEVAAASRAVSEALAHPLLARARAASRLLREASVMLVEPDGSIVEGVVDLAFHETDIGFTVVDFKTDVQIAAKQATYARQVAAYARAIATATGEPAQGVILSV